MKQYINILAIVAVAMVMFVTPSQAQVTPDSVNGWNYIGTFDATSDAHYTTLSADHVQGNTSQLFGWNVTAWDWHSGDNYFGVTWEKTLDLTYVTPIDIRFSAKVASQSGSFTPVAIITILHGDSIIGGGNSVSTSWDRKFQQTNVNSDPSVPRLFNKVRFQFAIAGLVTGSAEILIDSLTLHYQDGPDVMLDPFEQPPTFSAAPIPVQLDTVLLTNSNLAELKVSNVGGSPIALHVTSVVSTNPVFSVTPSDATIAPNDSAVFTVTFSPADTGNFQGSLIFHHNGASSQDTVPVSGVCAIPESSLVVTLNFDLGWQLISLPVVPAPGTVLPNSNAYLYCYHGSYIPSDTMFAGVGYWIRVVRSPIPFVGFAHQDTTTLPVQQRWNIVGTVSTPTAVSDISSLPPGLMVSNFYGYNGNNYFIADTLWPGHAYWIKASADGHIMVQQPHNTLAKAQGYGPLRIVDSGELPPPPPGGYHTPPPVRQVPTQFALEQNYPNPFNPTTTIKYSLPAQGMVHLTVYNLLGQEVATLVSEQQAAGVYAIQWNAASVPSGVYFYQLRTGEAIVTKKLTVIK